MGSEEFEQRFDEQSEKINALIDELFEIVDEQGAEVIDHASENDEIEMSREDAHLMRGEADVFFILNKILDRGCQNDKQRFEMLKTMLAFYIEEQGI